MKGHVRGRARPKLEAVQGRSGRPKWEAVQGHARPIW